MSIFDNDETFSDYCKEVNNAYWAEEEEMKAGIHPSQVKERIEKALSDLKFNNESISFLDWNIDGPKVKVSTNGSYFGIFNYETNVFEMVSYLKIIDKTGNPMQFMELWGMEVRNNDSKRLHFCS